MALPVKLTGKKILLAALIICVFLDLVSLNQLIRRRRNQIGNDDISLRVEQLRIIRERLPVSASFGYVDDSLKESCPNEAAFYNFVTTQYGLSPALLEYDHQKHFIIGNFTNSKLPALLLSDKYKLLENFGNGLYLIERK
jgi:hypothetical protein